MNISFLGAHNLETDNSKFVCLLIDNILALDAGALSGCLSRKAQQQLKALFITHKHYDHVRDVPAIAISCFFQESTLNLYSSQTVYDAISAHLLNNSLYPNFMELPESSPAVKFTTIEPYKPLQVEGYTILAVPVNHDDNAVGYQVTSADGKTLFYTGDTGTGLTDCWQHISPQLLIIEVTLADRNQEFAYASKHLTPHLLKEELTGFNKINGYFPEVVVLHMDPAQEEEIKTEIEAVARDLNIRITCAYEGMQLHL
jgi:ribonuclease BN (tRNA processing enzyme)